MPESQPAGFRSALRNVYLTGNFWSLVDSAVTTMIAGFAANTGHTFPRSRVGLTLAQLRINAYTPSLPHALPPFSPSDSVLHRHQPESSNGTTPHSSVELLSFTGNQYTFGLTADFTDFAEIDQDGHFAYLIGINFKPSQGNVVDSSRRIDDGAGHVVLQRRHESQ